jgi:CubicO group peptidase (beta-lactamase class C family)
LNSRIVGLASEIDKPMKKNSKQMIRILLFVGTIISLYFVPWPIVKAWIKPLPDTVQEQVDKAADYGFDGIIVCVNKKGNQSELYASGYKNRENKIPANPRSLFKIASISKLYVAVAVAKLAAEKRLSLDKTLADYLPELAQRIENADKITLRMMVQHRSGIPNYTDTPNYCKTPPKTDMENLELVLDKPADFKPGKKYRYSNTNYLLIGEILDKTLGYSHHQYIKQEILMPLGLKNTYSLLSEVNINDVMSGYDEGFKGDLKNNDFTSPAGSMVATAEDVGIFLRALNDGSLLADEEQTIYATIYTYDHTGLLPGYSSIAKYHKDIDTVVILFVNTSGGYSWNLSEIMYNRIVKILKKRYR